MNVLKKSALQFFIFTITLLALYLYFEKDTLAVKNFFDGNVTVQQDVTTPTDDYYGGYDSTAAGAPPSIASTNLTFIINTQQQNTVQNIFGGGLSGNLLNNTVLGDIDLTVTATHADGIYGGSETNGGHFECGGSITSTITDCVVTHAIYGGSLLTNGVGTQSIHGNIKMILNNTQTPILMGVGDATADQPQGFAVNGDVELDITNSQITTAWLTSFQDAVNVQGNVSLIALNSTFTDISVTENSNIHGNVNVVIGQQSLLNGDFNLSKNGNIDGDVNIIVNDSQINGIANIAPSGLGLIGGNINFTATNSTIQTLRAAPQQAQNQINNITLDLRNSNINELIAGVQGTTNNLTIQSNNCTFTGTLALGGAGIIQAVTANFTGGNIDDLRIGGIGGGYVGQSLINLNNTNVDTFFMARQGDLYHADITINNSILDEFIIGGAGNINNATININGTTFTDIIVGRAGTIGTIDINITDSVVRRDFDIVGGNGNIDTATVTSRGCTINSLSIGAGAGLINTTIVNLHNTTINDLLIGGPGNVTSATTNIYESIISNLLMGGNGRPNLLTTNIYSGQFNHITLGGTTGLGTGVVNIHEGAFINTLTLGSTIQLGDVEVVIANIEGGDINNIITGHADNLTLNFEPWDPSYVRNGISGPSAADTINIQKHARTHWGTPGNTFPVKTENFLFAGELFIAEEATVELSIGGNFVADGGILIPENFLPTTNVPMIQFIGTPGSNLVLNTPLTVILAFSPDFLGVKSIPLATATPEFANPDLFAAQNRKSIVWSDTIFDKSTNTWYLTNIRASEDFYGFSAAREATNWLREQHVWTIQRRSSQLLDHGTEGLWINVQGGHEKLDAAIGEAKMPWVMASMGYDFLKTLPSSNMKAIYGFGLGASKGDNKWSTINTTKNDILMGMIAGYAGLMHNSGIYGTLTAQFAVGSITTKCTGFSKNYKWKEMIPTEALEFGWQHTFENGFKINPRGQVICEQLTKNHFKLPYENDTATLDKSFLATMVAGVAGEYSFQTSTPLHLQASVDWMQGVAGDFAAKSRILKTTFKDKNDSTVIRSSLGLHSQLRENLGIHCNVFADVGNDKGIGGQLGATYTF